MAVNSQRNKRGEYEKEQFGEEQEYPNFKVSRAPRIKREGDREDKSYPEMDDDLYR